MAKVFSGSRARAVSVEPWRRRATKSQRWAQLVMPTLSCQERQGSPWLRLIALYRTMRHPLWAWKSCDGTWYHVAEHELFNSSSGGSDGHENCPNKVEINHLPFQSLLCLTWGIPATWLSLCLYMPRILKKPPVSFFPFHLLKIKAYASVWATFNFTTATPK